MKYIRRTLVQDTFRNIQLLKALAMVYFIKHKIKSSNIRRWSINFIHELTGLHATTIRKRLQTLKAYGLILIEGENIIFRSTVSKHNDRNVNIGRMDFTSVMSVQKSLQALQIVLIQLRKDYCKHTIRTAKHGKSFTKVKAAKAACRRYGFGEIYREFGLSYATMAKKIGNSVQTIFNTVKFGVKKKYFSKENHFVSTKMKGVNYTEIDGYTFTTADYGFKVAANTYTVGCRWK